MKDFFANYLSDKYWLIKEESWERRLQGIYEAKFTLGNGYLGSRGVLEETPYDASPGTFIAGIYDKSGAQVTELVNLPNPLDFRIITDGEKLDVIAMDVLRHRRFLDMKKGLLARRTLYLNSRKEKFDYQSLRFFSMKNVHLGIMQVYFTPLSGSADIVIQSGIDTSVTNHGVLTEGRKKHFQLIKVESLGEINYVGIRTFESKVSVGYASLLRIFNGQKDFATLERTFHLKVKKGQTIRFTKMFSVYSLRKGSERIESCAIGALRKAVNKGFKSLLEEHTFAWDQKWRDADIIIAPPRALQNALRFNIYHMLICGSFTEPVSIGARTLSGEGYRGHIFWDAEIYLLPFFIYTNPTVARNMLYYRHDRLNMARKIAKRRGFKGALFPWESADKGGETTPGWHKDLDGRIVEIYTAHMEHHISADIAYAVYHYFLATGDEDFMLRAGLELIFETARFWASRVTYNRFKDTYQIKQVIGPDEFHKDVDNNAYTNAMARQNLFTACRLYNQKRRKPSKRFRSLVKKIGLTDKEVDNWENIAERIKISIDRKRDLIEAFDGYFKKKDIPIRELDINFMPVFPRGLLIKDIDKTQLLKQADTVMLLYLLSENFSLAEKKKNFLYYDRRTIHKSSLSTSIHAILALETADFEKAHHYFLYSLYADLKNLHGNTTDGIHAASLGGIWQVVVNGLAGMRVKDKDGVLIFGPKLLPGIKEVKFKLKYRGFDISVVVYRKMVEILAASKDKKRKLTLEVYEQQYRISPNKKYIFVR
jgi:kojibiose phosphorylase